MSKKHVVLVFPESGPLIRLSMGKHLDLLLNLEVPIFILDEVFRECTHDLARPGATSISEFVIRHPEWVHVAPTFVGEMAERVRKEGRMPGRGLREAAIAEFFANIDRFIDPKDPVLIVFEDNDMGRINAVVRENVHMLSTSGLLKRMASSSVIDFAEP